ncbi:tryptophan 2,3-dioxygenase [Cyclonatronum proteinivorum]|uniref:Tryptophan 2,3-dioxygenase n=1 Tax=Cyclonatronum proteinivorum TaxID=1457365 RepID=A0A345UMZ3_9BACT|nr:tryptophan 2,3-dioxygenase family protein [Cyclonatronum proteinivorum]AXJ01845.1 tryptophan 2,3-dioxygenase [Cyclonatronum proteinivorum]
MTVSKSLTYTRYLKINELLALQECKSDPEEHDETLFIIIHQTYELWFKQILHEFDLLRQELNAGRTWTSIKTMRRILTIMKTLVGQIDILETMTPLSFNQFRKFLDSSSGFQSVQFREMEILCGLRYPLMTNAHRENQPALDIIKGRMEEQTLWEAFITYLQKQGHSAKIPDRVNDKGLMFEPHPHNQQVLTDVMHNDPESSVLCELFVDFDEGLQEWRYRHVKMVERTIGTKKGTGGSDGVGYLRKTTNTPIFPDLWAIRAYI